MNELSRTSPDDATAPQPHEAIRFSWSGFCKDGMMRRYAFILAHAHGSQPTRKTTIPRPGNTSRRIAWRNSPLCQRFWCPSFRPPVQRRLQSLCSISSRSQRRSMSSRHLPKVNITDISSGQSTHSAPTLRAMSDMVCGGIQCRSRFFARFQNFLWRRFVACVSVESWRGGVCRVVALPGDHVLPDSPARLVNRSITCRKSLSCWPSAQLSRCLPAPARPRSQSRSWQHPSWPNRSHTRVSIVEFLTGRAPAPDPRFTRAAFVQWRQTC